MKLWSLFAWYSRNGTSWDAIKGLVVWAVVLILFPPGWAATALLLAALVLVPMGLKLARAEGTESIGDSLLAFASKLQFPAAMFLVIAVTVPAGSWGRLLVLPWLITTLVVAASGLIRIIVVLCPLLILGFTRVAAAESAKPRPWHRRLCHSHPTTRNVIVDTAAVFGQSSNCGYTSPTRQRGIGEFPHSRLGLVYRSTRKSRLDEPLAACSAWRIDKVSTNAGLTYLAVAGVWTALSCFGVRPMGFEDQIVLLTAVHFHYAGFVLPLLAGQVGRASESVLGRIAEVGVIVGVPAVAVGIAFSPVLEWLSACALAGSCAIVAFLELRLGIRSGDRLARWLWIASGASLWVGMVLAIVYAAGEYWSVKWLTIPQMLPTHGAINAVGFGMLGLMACIAAERSCGVGATNGAATRGAAAVG